MTTVINNTHKSATHAKVTRCDNERRNGGSSRTIVPQQHAREITMKTRIPILFLSLIAAQACFAQGQWTSLGSMPTSRYSHTVNELNGKIYVVGGANTETGAYPRTAFVYDTSSGTWTQFLLRDNTIRAAHSSCVVGGKLFVMGGNDSSRTIATMDMFDPDGGQWTAKAPLSIDRGLAACASIGGRIYVFGGMRFVGSSYNFTGLRSGEVYDTSNGTWAPMADMPTGRWGHSAVAVNGKIYVFGGRSVTQYYSSVEVYEPKTDTWSTKSNMPTFRYCLTTCVLNNAVYAIGGWAHSANGPIYDKVEVYDPAIDGWHTEAPMPVARAVLASIVLDGRIYVYGGSRTTHPLIGTSEIYRYESSSIAASPRTILCYAEPGGLTDSIRCTVKNAYRASVEVASVTTSRTTPFELLNLPQLPRTLAPGDSVTFNVAFRPATTGTFFDTVLVDVADAGLIDGRIPLAGTGITVSPLDKTRWYAAKSGFPSGSFLRMGDAGTFAPVGLFGIPEVQGMAIDNAGFCHAAEPAGSFSKLYRIDGALGGCALRMCLPLPGLRALAFGKKDTLYGATSAGRLYRFNLQTGDTVFIGSTDRVEYSGLCFGPTTGRLWASSGGGNDTLYLVNRRTGEATPVGSTHFGAGISSIAFTNDGMLFGLTEGWDSYFVTIDTVTMSVTRLGPPNPGYRAIAIAAGIVGAVTGELAGEVPREFTLEQNYPNPFNPGTVIRYRLQKSCDVRLSVYDVLGREVSVLVDAKRDAGAHEVEFNGSHLASGVYLYRLQARPLDSIVGRESRSGDGDLVQTRKLMLVR